MAMREFEFTTDVKPRPRINKRKLKRLQPRLPALVKLLVLSHQIDRIIAEGRPASLSDLARQIGVSSARVSQIRRFAKLAPEIQDRLLRRDLPTLEALGEREFLPVLLTAYHPNQTKALDALLPASPPKPSTTTITPPSHKPTL